MAPAARASHADIRLKFVARGSFRRYGWITWIGAHSPQAKGRVERNFGTAQDRLVKGMRVAGVKTIEQANQYLEEEYLVWWERELMVEPANHDDAHRKLDKSHNLAASLSYVETRQVRNDYTIRIDSEFYQIEHSSIVAGLRKANVRVEYQHPSRVYELVESDRVDLGLVSFPHSSRNIKAMAWREEPMVLVCAPGHQLASRQQFLDLARYLIEIASGGPARAAELQPSASLLVLQVP